MTPQQYTAITHVSYLAEETAHPRFGVLGPGCSIIVTVNAGYE